MVDIDRPKIGEAIKLFDEGNDLTKADVASLLQVKQ
jgi:hypothetical protein